VKEILCKLFNEHEVNYNTQDKTHPAEPLVPENLKRYKLPDTEQIPAELFQAPGNTLLPEFTKLLILFGIDKKWSERDLLLCLCIRR
jgi:hypothetical protein